MMASFKHQQCKSFFSFNIYLIPCAVTNPLFVQVILKIYVSYIGFYLVIMMMIFGHLVIFYISLQDDYVIPPFSHSFLIDKCLIIDCQLPICLFVLLHVSVCPRFYVSILYTKLTILSVCTHDDHNQTPETPNGICILFQVEWINLVSLKRLFTIPVTMIKII